MSTLTARLAALAQRHTDADSNPTSHPQVKEILKGIPRTHGRAARLKEPASTEDIMLMVDAQAATVGRPAQPSFAAGRACRRLPPLGIGGARPRGFAVHARGRDNHHSQKQDRSGSSRADDRCVLPQRRLLPGHSVAHLANSRRRQERARVPPHGQERARDPQHCNHEAKQGALTAVEPGSGCPSSRKNRPKQSARTRKSLRPATRSAGWGRFVPLRSRPPRICARCASCVPKPWSRSQKITNYLSKP
jgi:hypothetical protein